MAQRRIAQCSVMMAGVNWWRDLKLLSKLRISDNPGKA
jgi:hypothetical protein